MPRPTKPDPYNGFKDDRERRLALNTRVRWYAVAVMAAAVAAPGEVMERIRWLMNLLP